MDLALGQIDGGARAGQLVGPPPVDVDGRVGRRHLAQQPGRQRAAQGGHTARVHQLALRIARRRGPAQAGDRLVRLVLRHQEPLGARRAADEHEQQPGGERVQRAGMPDPHPAGPAAGPPSPRRTPATMSCEVRPAGLSISRTPSSIGPLSRCNRRGRRRDGHLDRRDRRAVPDPRRRARSTAGRAAALAGGGVRRGRRRWRPARLDRLAEGVDPLAIGARAELAAMVDVLDGFSELPADGRDPSGLMLDAVLEHRRGTGLMLGVDPHGGRRAGPGSPSRSTSAPHTTRRCWPSTSWSSPMSTAATWPRDPRRAAAPRRCPPRRRSSSVTSARRWPCWRD